MRFGGAALGIAVAFVAGCGGEEPSPAPPDTLVRASEATKKLGGHHVEMDVRMRFEGLVRSQTYDIEASGDIDPGANRSEYRGDFSELTGEGSPYGEDSNDALVEVIERGPVLYVKMGALTEVFHEAGVDATWLKEDRSKPLTARTRKVRESIADIQEDPGEVLDYLDAARGRVERLGRETIAGVETTRYRGATRLTELGVGKAPVIRRNVQANAREVMRSTGRRSVPVEAWIDRRGAVRRVVLDYRLRRNPANGRPIDGRLRIVANLSGFGRAVDPPPPPPDEVISLEELVRLAE
jgi:hypothetical protein